MNSQFSFFLPILLILFFSIPETFGLGLDNLYEKKISNYEKLLENLQKDVVTEVIVELQHNLYIDDKLKLKGKLKQHSERVEEIQTDFITNFELKEDLIVYKYNYSPQILLKIDQNLLEKLILSPMVRLIHDNSAEEVFLDSSVAHVGANIAFEQGITGAGYSIVIIDTGVESTHPFLTGKILNEYEACFSAHNENKKSTCTNQKYHQTGIGAGAPCQHSLCYHGTHVAGIAAGKGPDFSGIAKDSSIIPIQVFHIGNDKESCKPDYPPCLRTRPSETNAALEHVIDLAITDVKISAVNLSLGSGSYSSSCPDDPRRMTIDILHNLGIAVVVSVGNSGDKNGIATPSCVSNAISVGSTSKVDIVRSTSQSAGILDLLAPGATILSSIPDGKFEKKSGTSFSAPHITGAFTLLKQANPNASVNDILVQLKTTGKPIIDQNNDLIKPRIQIDKALSLVVGKKRVLETEEVLPPLKQWKQGKPIDEIFCDVEKFLLINIYNGKPACVNLQTSENLIKRGWALIH